MSNILAITGLVGAGKRVATEYIIRKTGWPKIYFGDITAEGLRSRGLPVNEQNERKFREEIRKTHGMAAYALLNLPKIKSLFPVSSVVLESFYSWEEYVLMKTEFGERFKVLAVWASPEVRQQRLKNRAERPLKAHDFTSRDFSQIENLHQAGPIARADFMVVNEGSLKQLNAQLDRIIKNLRP